MSFDRPGGLWLLALAVPVIALHYYRGRVRRMAVPSLLFWEQVLVEEERKSALKRLRHLASLLLSLAALLFLAGAAAGPRVGEPARWILVLDGSASMRAAGADGRRRIDLALDAARGFLRGRALGDSAAVFDLAGPLLPFTEDLDGLAGRLAEPPPSTGGDLRPALAAGTDARVVFFSDRPAPDGVLGVRVGAPAENSGWTSGALVRRPGEKKATLSLDLSAFGAPGARSEVLLLNGRELARRPAAAGAREWALDPGAFPGSRLEEGGLVEVLLEPPDALAEDDAARFVLGPLVPPPVVVFHPGKPDELLMHALQTLRAGGLVGEVSAAPLSRYAGVAGRIGEGMVAIFDRAVPPALPARGGVLVLGSPRGTLVEKPVIADWDRESPALRGADFAGLRLRRARILDGAPLIRAVEGPVATLERRGGRVLAEFGFSADLAESDLAVRPAFLATLFSFCEWASWRGLRAFPPQARWGEPLRAEARLRPELAELHLETPDRIFRIGARDGRLDESPRLSSGFARLAASDRSEWVAANLFDASESDLQGETVPTASPEPAPWPSRVPWTSAAAAVAVLLLLAEAVLFWRVLVN
jgi:hypothetical protein